LAIVTKRWDGMRWTRQRRAREIAGRVDPRKGQDGAQDERRFNASVKTTAGGAHGLSKQVTASPEPPYVLLTPIFGSRGTP
jgi:hypothetical protein